MALYLVMICIQILLVFVTLTDMFDLLTQQYIHCLAQVTWIENWTQSLLVDFVKFLFFEGHHSACWYYSQVQTPKNYPLDYLD